MHYVIGIVPPSPYRQRISEFQRRWPNNQTPGIVEPHITVKAQGGLTPDLSWIHPVIAACSTFPRFTAAITVPKFFGDAVVYLGIASTSIHALHRRLVNAISPTPEMIARYFELDHYVPHVTLGQTMRGMTALELRDMGYAADEILRPFPTFDVTGVRIYQEIDGRYEPFRDVPLA